MMGRFGNKVLLQNYFCLESLQNVYNLVIKCPTTQKNGSQSEPSATRVASNRGSRGQSPLASRDGRAKRVQNG